MNKKEIMEIKRRFKKEQTTITRLAGCYVDANKEKVASFTEPFLNLEDEELLKYLEICSKTLSGTPKNNLLELSFAPGGEEEPQDSLLALRQSKLENDALLDAFYDHVIETYDVVGNYLILLFYDTYDIPMKTSDEMLLDESDEVYEYILCAVCPVALSKPGLGWREEESRIAVRIRDWVVGVPESGFLFPAFTDRSADIHSALVYTKNAKAPHREFWEECLGVTGKFTSTEKRSALFAMIEKSVGDTEETPEILLDVQQNISDYNELKKEHTGEEHIVMETEDITEILEDSGIPESKAERISRSYEEFFPDEKPDAEELYENRALKNNELRKEKKALQEKVIDLNALLKDVGAVTEDGEIIDVVLKVSEAKAQEVETGFVDGRRCLIVPLEADDTASVNGEPFES